MRILHIISTYYPVLGGTERLAQKVSEILSQQGHEVKVITTNVSNVEGYYQFGIPTLKIPEIETINGVEVKRINYGNSLYKLGSFIVKIPFFWQRLKRWLIARLMIRIGRQFLKNLKDEINNFKPDVVMTMPHLVVNVQATLMVHKQLDFPLVIVPLLHEESPNWPFEAMKLALNQADAVIAVTKSEMERLNSFYEVPSEKLFLVPVGIDIPQDFITNNRKNQVLFLGRKVKSKGLFDLIEAMKLVWQKLPNLELIIAGSRTPETEEIDHFINLLSPLEKQQITSLDNISETEKQQLLTQSSCLILPSRVESFGIVILEAWAHYLPVITLDLPVFRDIVDNSLDGMLVQAGNINQLAEAIIYMIENPQIASEMGKKGRKKVEEFYIWEEVTQGYLQAYEYACHQEKSLNY